MTDEKLESLYFQLFKTCWQLINAIARLGAVLAMVYNLYKNDTQQAILWGIISLVIK